MEGVAGIMWIFDVIWTFRYHGCSRRISKVRSSDTALRPATESISSWLPCSSQVRSWYSAGRGWADGPDRGQCDRVYRHLVDALLPNMVPDLHCPQRPRDLRGNHPEVGEETPARSNAIWLKLRILARSRR